MRKTVLAVTILMLSGILTGCAAGLVTQAVTGTRSTVFRVAGDQPVAAGEAELTVSASLKTHRDFECPLNLPHSHGTADYRLVMNVDGQPHSLTPQLREENLVSSAPGNPEDGIGIRYLFREKVHLAAGSHRIILALPDDQVAVAREIRLDPGSVNSLTVEPVYHEKGGARKTMANQSSHFREGIKGLRLTFNGTPL